ncbi:MAG: response regulator [Treponema sp.]|jgi:signal transduction histidine kinase/CheY-like chemotaxis protein|nr:response regulator [Treponema sp.]
MSEKKGSSLRNKVFFTFGVTLFAVIALTIAAFRFLLPEIPGFPEPDGGVLVWLNRLVLGFVCIFTLIVFVQYILAGCLILRPIEHLTRDIHKITSVRRLPVERGAFLEIQSLCASINNMLDKMTQSSMSTNVFRNIFNGIQAFLFVSDPETCRILFINESMKRCFGLDDRVIGQPCWKAFRKNQDGICPFCPLEKLKRNGDQVLVWEEFNTLTGRYYENTSSLIKWNNGASVYLQHSVDISNLKIAEKETLAAKELAEQSNAAKTSFLARMSHEMRTPLNAIIGMTAIARQHSHDPEKVAYCLPKISEASVHLLGVITDILDMSKIGAGKFQLVNAEFDLYRMIHRVIEMMTFRIDEKRHKFDFSIEESIPRLVAADEHRLSQVLTNLLSNAIKFTPPQGYITLRVLREAFRGGALNLRFEIGDNGIGIAEEQRDRLFMLFEQGEGDFSRKHEGVGLGLSICKSIVELMGGEIWVESQLGHGSTFIFEIAVKAGGPEIPDNRGENLPWMPAETPEMPAAAVLPDACREEDEVTGNIFSGKTILLAEDVEINREIAIVMLEDTAAKVECAESGTEAVRMYRENPEKYQCILMDIHMPGMDGLEATRRIRTLEESFRKGKPAESSRRIPIIAMTANVFREDVEMCLTAGMNDHLGKPIDFDEVMKKLKIYMR